MTRTITTADLAPLVTRHGADFETSKWTVELAFPASEPVSIHSWQADLLAAIPSAPVVPVVSDAAVDAIEADLNRRVPARDLEDRNHARALIAEVRRLRETAALPFLGAAPSATREDVGEALHPGLFSLSDYEYARRFDNHGAGARAQHQEAVLTEEVDPLLARFSVTEGTDR